MVIYNHKKEVNTMKSKFSPKMLNRIANAWYKGYKNGTGVGKYHYKIEYSHEKSCWGIWRCLNDYLDKEFIDSYGHHKTMWEWVEEIPMQRFAALVEQEIMIL